MVKIIDFEKEFRKRHPKQEKAIDLSNIKKVLKLIERKKNLDEKFIKTYRQLHITNKKVTKKFIKEFVALFKKTPNAQDSLMHCFFIASVHYSERINTLSDAFFQVYKKDNLITSLIVLRSIIETIAMFLFLNSKVEVHAKKKNRVMVSEIIDRHLYGSRTEHSRLPNLLQLKPYHINDALEYAFKQINKKTFKFSTPKGSYEEVFEFINKGDYDILSELVHPVSPYRHNIKTGLIDSDIMHEGEPEGYISLETIKKRFLYMDFYQDLIMKAAYCIRLNTLFAAVAQENLELLIEI